MDYQKKIQEITAAIASFEVVISQLRSSAKSWGDQGRLPLRPAYRKKDTADREMKLAKEADYLAQAKAQEGQIAGLQIERQSVIDQQKNESIVSKNLSEKGISAESAKLVAEGTARAAEIVAENTSKAQAQAIIDSSKVANSTTVDAAENTLKIKNVFVFVIILVVLSICFALYKKNQLK
jgi:hypothetical protein